MMRAVVLWGLLVLLCQHTLVNSHVLGPSVTSDLTQLKSLLQRIEETLSEVAQEEGGPEADYGETNQEPEQSQTGRGWNPEQEVDQEALIPERSEGRSRTTGNMRSRLQDLLLTTRKRSSCFGARMDRIGNAGGLGCNSGKG